ncbi:MAG: RNA polymerase sigma factor [Melioribacteraceae bacterium]|nr:RNA polymerase sigma factor [Melioribacteraceae bacterium]
MNKEIKYKFLIKQYSNIVYTYALYMMKDKMDADDVTQEVLIKIWDKENSFNILKAKSWIMRTTHNLCIDYLRRRSISYSREISIGEEFDDMYNLSDEQNEPESQTHVKFMSEKIKREIQKLPENLKSVFVLYEINGFKYREISKTLGIPVNSVKVYLMRARKKLQEQLKNYEAQEVL